MCYQWYNPYHTRHTSQIHIFFEQKHHGNTPYFFGFQSKICILMLTYFKNQTLNFLESAYTLQLILKLKVILLSQNSASVGIFLILLMGGDVGLVFVIVTLPVGSMKILCGFEVVEMKYVVIYILEVIFVCCFWVPPGRNS